MTSKVVIELEKAEIVQKKKQLSILLIESFPDKHFKIVKDWNQ